MPSTVPAPRVNAMEVAASTATSSYRCPSPRSPRASVRTAVRPRRWVNAWTSIAPAHRHATTPSSTRAEPRPNAAPGTAPAPAPASPPSAPTVPTCGSTSAGPDGPSAAAATADPPSGPEAGIPRSSSPGPSTAAASTAAPRVGAAGPSRRPIVVPTTPRRAPICTSVHPCARHAAACSSCAAVSLRGRPRSRTRPADPSSRARPRNSETYVAVKPNSAATSRPGNRISVKATTATLRIPRSPASKANNARAPSITTRRPSTSTNRRRETSGTPSNTCATATDTPTPYHTSALYAARRLAKTQVTHATVGGLGPRPLRAPLGRRRPRRRRVRHQCG